jgi:IclR family pca regulon transcriptional regulator
MIDTDDREFIQSLAKGLAVIEAFGADSPVLTLSEVARKAGISPGSARRVLRTLQQLDYLHADGPRFSLAPRTLQLGYAYLSSQPLASLVQPRLTQLVEKLEGSCSVSVLDGHDVVYIARATGKALARDYMSVGTRFPAHATSPGKVLLAALAPADFKKRIGGQRLAALTPHTITSLDKLQRVLDQVRAQGWAVNDQETSLGHRSIAVPILANDQIVAALGVGCVVARVTLKGMIEQYLPKLRATAEGLSEVLTAGERFKPSPHRSAMTAPHR